ncbi:unnamed protein product [Phytophthora fragariaefolia]|uniref:Unnamed protein product n=1 Tax=Phytophthora fragariaefolia TaxID=1490495 RepID=A0A9W6YNV1_9STRA|nr:unnamed protein product [Phytophthora fragariaefolia]
MTSVKLILVIPAKHHDVPNAYVKAEKEVELDIFLRLQRGTAIPEDVRKCLGVDTDSELVLELVKALYGLKKTSRLWNQFLHKTLSNVGFEQGRTDL